MKKCILTIVLFLNSILLFSSSNVIFEHIRTEGGLISASVNSITSDSLGFMWFATNNGLNRFSGSDFKHYDIAQLTNIDSDKNVLNVKNIDGDLWATMRSGHLFKYNYYTDQFELKITKNNHSFRDIYQVNSNKLLLSGSSVFCYDILSQELEEVYSESNNYFRTARQIDNKLFVASNKGIYVFNINEDNLELDRVILVQNYIQTIDIFEDKLVVGTLENGLLLLTKEGKIVRNSFFGYGANIQSIKSKDSVIYVGVNRVGLILLDEDFIEIESYSHDPDISTSLSINSIHDIFIDKEKRIWLSTFRKGIDVFDQHENSFTTIQHERNKPNSLHNSVVRSICETVPGDFWFGTEKGISLFESDRNKWKVLSTLKNEAVLYMDSWGDYVAVSTYGAGLLVLDKYTGEILDKYNATIGANDFIYNSYVDSEQNLWFAGLENIFRLDINRNLTEYPVSNVKKITQLANGKILACSFDGLFEISEEGRIKTILPDLLKNNLIWTIFAKGDTLWLGTEGGGMKIINLNTKEHKKVEEISSNMIFDICQSDSEDLWLLTSEGIGRYNRKSNQYVVYSTKDNLPTNDYRLGKFLRTSQGELLVSSSFGLVKFNPEEVHSYSGLSDVFLTKLEISGNAYLEISPMFLEELELSYNQNSLSFTFESVGFTNNDRIRYRWRLIGIDDDWAYSKERVANYSNLSPGNYTLEFLCSNGDGIWMPVPKTISISITPPIWDTIFAKILYVIVFLFSLWGASNFYRSKLKRRYTEDKIRSFVDIAHDINNMVSVIKLSTEKITQGMPMNSSTKMLLQNAERLNNWATQLITFQKAERGGLRIMVERVTIAPFISQIAEGFAPLLDQKRITIIENIDSDISLWCDRILLERLINNLISNAIKYSRENSNIFIRAQINGNNCEISFTDEGIGIPKEAQKEIFKRFYRAENVNDVSENIGSGVGLMLSKHIVKLHHGKIDFKSEIGKGSVFIVLFKLGHDHFSDDQCIEESNVEIHEEIVDIKLDSFSNKRILLIEDNDDFRTSLRDELKDVFSISEARNGEEGMMKATEIMPDIIITDIMMPRLSGSELCYKLKNDTATSHIPIIVLTSLATTQEKVDNLEYGADAFIEKPLNIKLLKLTIRNIFTAQEGFKNYFDDLTKQKKSSKIHAPNSDNAFMGRVTDLIKDQLQSNKSIDIEKIASDLGFSRSVFYRRIKSITDLSPATFIQKVKLIYAADLIADSIHLSIKEIAYKCGFVNSKHFSVAFKREFELSPSLYRKAQNSKKAKPNKE